MENEKLLIDLNKIKPMDFPSYEMDGLDVVRYLSTLPTVDAVEVVHGRWEKASETMPIYRCSVCKERNLFKNGNNVLSNYCPYCGALMDGGNKDG